MNNCLIRFATEEDIPFINGCIYLLADYEKLTQEVHIDEETIRRDIFEKKYAEVLIAEQDSERAGFALFFHNYSTFAGKPGIYLEDLYVLEDFRGQGCGNRLLEELARVAIERGCGRMEWSVLDWNEPAIRFYQSLGAGPVKGWTVYRLTGAALSELAEK